MENKKLLLSAKMVDCRTGKRATVSTEVKVFSDLTCMYITFDCAEKSRTPKYDEYNKPLYEGDIVEVLLTLGSPRKYLEIEVNQNSAIYCAVIENRDGEGNISIQKLPKALCEVNVTLTEGKWCTEIIICYSSILLLGFEMHKAMINLLRQDYNGDKLNLYAVYPTYSDTFHKSAALKEIKIHEIVPKPPKAAGVCFHNLKI